MKKSLLICLLVIAMFFVIKTVEVQALTCDEYVEIAQTIDRHKENIRILTPSGNITQIRVHKITVTKSPGGSYCSIAVNGSPFGHFLLRTYFRNRSTGEWISLAHHYGLQGKESVPQFIPHRIRRK